MKKNFLALGLLTTVSFSLSAQIQADSGKMVFMARCAGCHNVNRVVTGPALAGVESRHDRNWINRFIHSPRTLINQGDEQATALYVSFNKIQMPDHADLTERDITHILAYIRSETGKIASGATNSPATVNSPRYLPIAITNYSFFGSYALLVLLLAGSLLALVRVTDLDRAEKRGPAHRDQSPD